jgi:hypothetical protein
MRRYRDSGAGGSDVMKGNLIASDAYRARNGNVWKPKWDDSVRLDTVMRFTGPATADGKGLMPHRYSGDANDFTEFIHCLPIFSGGSYNRYTFIAGYKNPEDPDDILSPDEYPTPAQMLQKAAKRLAQADAEMERILFKGKNAVGPVIKYFGLLQGILLQYGTKNYRNSPKMPCIFTLSWSAKRALEEVLGKEVEGYVGDPEDYSKRFVAGDVLNADTGKLFAFFNAKAAAVAANTQAGPNWSNAGGNGGTDQSSHEFSSYGCEVVGECPLPKNPDGTLVFAQQGTLFTPWSQALRFLDEKEMVNILVQAYNDMPQLILPAFRSRYDELIPRYMKDGATVTMPGTDTTAPPAPVETAGTAPSAANGQTAVNWGGVVGPDGSSSEPAVTAPVSAEQLGDQLATPSLPVASVPATEAPQAPGAGTEPLPQAQGRTAEALDQLKSISAAPGSQAAAQ